MRRPFVIIGLLLAVFAVISYWLLVVNYFSMFLTSPAFKNGEAIPKKFTCEGGDMNPALAVEHMPQGVKTLALLMDDPDAPGDIFTHWIVWNIDPSAAFIKEESKPAGSAEGTNSGARMGYLGPCPPPGAPHRYVFTAYALDVQLSLMPGVRRPEFESAIKGHVLGKAELVGIYERK